MISEAYYRDIRHHLMTINIGLSGGELHRCAEPDQCLIPCLLGEADATFARQGNGRPHVD